MRCEAKYTYLGCATPSILGGPKCARTVLTDKPNGNNAERYERIKLAVVAGDDLGGELLSERNADTIGKSA
jgi:hypothetical protein